MFIGLSGLIVAALLFNLELARYNYHGFFHSASVILVQVGLAMAIVIRRL